MSQRTPPMQTRTAPHFPDAFARAIGDGDLAAIEQLIHSLGGGVLRAADRDGRTCLHLAAQANAPALIDRLIERGADPRQASEAGNTPLAEAVLRGHLEAARALLPVTPGVSRSRLIKQALRANQKAMALWLIRLRFSGGEAPSDQLGHFAVHFDCPAALRALLNHGLSRTVRCALSAHGASEGTLLHTAAAMPRPGCLKVLIDAGHELSARDRNGRTPLHWAAAAAQPEAVELLLSAGADPELRDHAGRTPREMLGAGDAAACREMFDIVERQARLAREMGVGATRGHDGPSL